MKTPLAIFKKLCIMSLVSGTFLLASCNKEEDPAPVSLIVGTWSLQSLDFDILVEGGQTLIEFLMDYGLSEEDAAQYAEAMADFDDQDPFQTIEFKRDGTWISDAGQGDPSGVWELSVDEKTLTLEKGTPDEGTATVTTLTPTDLVLSFNLSEEDDDLPEGLSIHVVMTLKR